MKLHCDIFYVESWDMTVLLTMSYKMFGSTFSGSFRNCEVPGLFLSGSIASPETRPSIRSAVAKGFHSYLITIPTCRSRFRLMSKRIFHLTMLSECMLV